MTRTQWYVVEYSLSLNPTRDSDWSAHSSHRTYEEAVEEHTRISNLMGTRYRIVSWSTELTVLLDPGPISD